MTETAPARRPDSGTATPLPASSVLGARKALARGDKNRALQILQEAVRERPDDFEGWLWLASLTPSPAKSLEFVRRAETLNPDHPAIHKARRWAERRLARNHDVPIVQASKGASAHRPEVGEPDGPSVQFPLPGSQSHWRAPIIFGGAIALLIALVGLFGFLLWETVYARNESAQIPLVLPAANDLNIEEVARSDLEALPVVNDSRAVNGSTAATAVAALPAKEIAGQATAPDLPRPTWTSTPWPTNTPRPTPTPWPTFVSPVNQAPSSRPFGVGPGERWIDVDLSAQKLVAYEGNTPVLSSVISSGVADHPTVTGQFRIWLSFESQTMDGRRLGYDYYLEDVPYVMYFYEDYALHGTYWHSNFGTPMSHGCVNMNTADAGWLYRWASVGTVVNVHQ